MQQISSFNTHNKSNHFNGNRKSEAQKRPKVIPDFYLKQTPISDPKQTEMNPNESKRRYSVVA